MHEGKNAKIWQEACKSVHSSLLFSERWEQRESSLLMICLTVHWSFLLWGLSRVSQCGARTWQQVTTLKSAAVPILKIQLIHECDDLITTQLEGRGCDTTPYILHAYIKPRACSWIREKKLTNLWDSSALRGAGPASAPCFETSTLVWTLDPGQSDCLLRKNEKILY